MAGIFLPGSSKGASGDITAVVAGDGLSGGDTSGDVTVTLDLHELTAAAATVANDSIAIIDANDSNASRKESIADLVGLIAGTNISAGSGVMSVADSAAGTKGAVIVGGTSPVSIAYSSGTATVSVTDSSTSAKGIASFSSDNFAASSGAITIKDNGVAIAEIADIARGSVIVGNASAATAELTIGSNNYVLTSDGTDIAWAAASAGAVTVLNSATENELVTVGNTTTELDAEANLTYASDLLTIASSSANLPRIDITNTHDLTTSGEIRFNKDSTGDDNDVMGKISWFGTDSSDNTHEELAYMDAIITDSAHGSEAASMRFYVAENDATRTLGLQLAGQADADGEIDVTIGAGAASTATIAGTLTMGTTVSMTNAGLLSVGNQTGISGVGTITSGVWNSSTVVASAYLDADTAHLTTTQTFTGVKTFDENIALTKSITFDSTPADPAYSGVTATFTAGEVLEAGEVVYFKASDARMWKAVANTGGTGLVTAEIMCVAMCAEDVSAGAAGLFLLQGFLHDATNFPTYAIGETLYVPEAEVGGQNVPEGIAPDSTNDFVQVIGWAASADSVYFSPNFTMVKVG